MGMLSARISKTRFFFYLLLDTLLHLLLLVLQLYYVCTMYTMIYTVTMYNIMYKSQYMVHTIVYMVNIQPPSLSLMTWQAKQ